MNLSSLLTVLAVVVGLYFLNYVRSCFRRLEAEGWRSSLFWAGAILFASSGLLGAGISATARYGRPRSQK